MNVGVIAYGLDRPSTGIGRYTMELIRALGADRESVDLSLLVAGNANGHVHASDLRAVSLPGCRLLPGLMTVGNVAVARAARLGKLDVVHDPTGVSPFLFGAGGAKTVVTIHDVFPWSCPGTSTALDTLIHHHWLPRVLPRVDAVITVSKASKQDIVRFLGVSPARVRVIPEGVNGRFRPVAALEMARVRARYGLPDRYLLFVGSVEGRKNLRRLLEACSILWQRGEKRPLVIAGPRNRRYEELMSALRDPEVERQVIFTGYLPEEDLPAVYSGADLFLFPSLYEGFGLPPLEAMACGTPVVCSNTSSLPEVVGDAAITVDPYNVEGLADTIRMVLSDGDLRQDLRARGLERARQFTWERTARETVEVYRQLCG